jgi:hypothetical protein
MLGAAALSAGACCANTGYAIRPNPTATPPENIRRSERDSTVSLIIDFSLDIFNVSEPSRSNWILGTSC